MGLNIDDKHKPGLVSGGSDWVYWEPVLVTGKADDEMEVTHDPLTHSYISIHTR